MPRVNKTFLLAAFVLAGCAHDPAARPPAPATPAAFSQAGAAADARWAEAFGDPALLDLLARARKASPDLALARARQREAVALLRAADAGDEPAFSLAAGQEASRISVANGRFPPGIPRRTDVTAVAAKASWELDLWGREAAKSQAAEAPKHVQKLDKQGRAYATGKRKDAVARVWIKPGSGKITVNDRAIDVYFARPVLRMIVQQPLAVAKRLGQYDLMVSVAGGGLSGQAGAVRHGLAKALTNYEPELRSALKKEGFLTRDSRVVERKKYGKKKARRSFQFSKR